MTVWVEFRKDGNGSISTNNNGNLFQQGSIVIGHVNFCTRREAWESSETE